MKQKTDAVKPNSQEDEKNLKQWKREKAFKNSKEFGASLVHGVAKGLSMYGQVAPCAFLGTPLPNEPHNFDMLKKW